MRCWRRNSLRISFIYLETFCFPTFFILSHLQLQESTDWNPAVEATLVLGGDGRVRNKQCSATKDRLVTT